MLDRRVLGKNVLLGYIIATCTVLFLAGGTGNVTYGEKCEDIKYEDKPLKWDSTGHDDNNPSKKKFEKMLDSASICEIAKAIDHMEITGSVKDWTEFKETIAYQGTSEEVQMCLKDRHDLPDDDGDKHLADYEIQKCALGDY